MHWRVSGDWKGTANPCIRWRRRWRAVYPQNWIAFSTNTQGVVYQIVDPSRSAKWQHELHSFWMRCTLVLLWYNILNFQWTFYVHNQVDPTVVFSMQTWGSFQMQDKYQETCYWTSFTADQQCMAKQVFKSSIFNFYISAAVYNCTLDTKLLPRCGMNSINDFWQFTLCLLLRVHSTL